MGGGNAPPSSGFPPHAEPAGSGETPGQGTHKDDKATECPSFRASSETRKWSTNRISAEPAQPTSSSRNNPETLSAPSPKEKLFIPFKI